MQDHFCSWELSSSSPSDDSTMTAGTAVAAPLGAFDDASEAATSVADAVRRELARINRYSLPIAFTAKHPESKESAEYKLKLASSSTATRADVTITCVETNRTSKTVVHADAIVARILRVSGIGAEESLADVFLPSSLCEDEHSSDDEPWKLNLVKEGVVTLLVQLPNDEFTEEASIFAPVAKLQMLAK